MCAVLRRQQSVCKKRKWCCFPRRSRLPGKNVCPVHSLSSFTVNHFLHTVYEPSRSVLRRRGRQPFWIFLTGPDVHLPHHVVRVAVTFCSRYNLKSISVLQKSPTFNDGDDTRVSGFQSGFRPPFLCFFLGLARERPCTTRRYPSLFSLPPPPPVASESIYTALEFRGFKTPHPATEVKLKQPRT